ncbi:proton-conducting transporter membrane subunit [Croceicoccus sp. BE223]|uniref:proton-conducting transporter transmembrane domain-containing protein n=1 Tax=Croceicoccus sp. BE223 TaxID=2817716 RepID=UPI00285EB022|nr:proton-conducting transporter membrane subunit [Croceicoccus sp. BE223]MDR7103628.1 NADH:ubiquinone oxidoreductase subunit 5 (subunit L)/multisubunit Na+/H+ antiporter MnhA subunit [Croceicoccus sp. BE223]
MTLVLWSLLGILPVVALLAWRAGAPLPGLSLAIAGMTLFVGALVATFSTRYMRSDRRSGRFFATLGGLVASVLFFVLTGNALLFVAGWLASGVLLARLIGHADEWGEARAAARRSIRTFLLGDLALLAGIGLLCWHGGTLRLDEAIAAVPAMPAPVVGVIAALLLAAAAARCALPPFSGWLTSSMTAPTPVSALMHAGLVNAGGFLLLRFAPVLEAAPAVRYAAIAIGLFAALWGIGIMAVSPGIKRSLAGSTVSQMGFMIVSCGFGAYAAALWHIVAHGLFKAWLFLNAGSAFGTEADRRPALEPGVVMAVAGITFVVGCVLAVRGTAGGELVPLLLAAATGAATLGTVLVGRTGAGSRVAITAMLIGLALLHLLGFELARDALAFADAPLISPTLAVIVLAAFLGGWIWQSRRIATRSALPPALYVHLLNAGMLRPLASGDRP